MIYPSLVPLFFNTSLEHNAPSFQDYKMPDLSRYPGSIEQKKVFMMDNLVKIFENVSISFEELGI